MDKFDVVVGGILAIIVIALIAVIMYLEYWAIGMLLSYFGYGELTLPVCVILWLGAYPKLVKIYKFSKD